MPDRHTAPPIYPIDRLELPLPEIVHLDNGIPVYITNMGTQEVSRLEVIFRAGRPYEQKKLAGRATVALLKEGTRHHDSAAIAETLDYYGASLHSPFSMDTSNLVLYSLIRHLDSVLPLFAEIISAPVFPEQELRSFVERNRRALIEDLSKTDVVAYRTVTEKMFGQDHPYGYNSFPETYADLQRSDLEKHFGQCYSADNCLIFLSGKIRPGVIPILNQHFGQLPRSQPPALRDMQVQQPLSGRYHIDHPHAVQTAIRIGRRLFNRHHEDYKGMYVLNTILGGYFGSRLMTNIREDKGYTYNIYSSMDTMRWDGSFYVGTEVSNGFVQDTLAQIYREMQDLIDRPVEDDELDMVRSYLMGNFLSMLDGPFNVSELIRTLVIDELPFSFFDELIETVRTIDRMQLQELAARYLQREQQWEIAVGAS